MERLLRNESPRTTALTGGKAQGTPLPFADAVAGFGAHRRPCAAAFAPLDGERRPHCGNRTLFARDGSSTVAFSGSDHLRGSRGPFAWHRAFDRCYDSRRNVGHSDEHRHGRIGCRHHGFRHSRNEHGGEALQLGSGSSGHEGTGSHPARRNPAHGPSGRFPSLFSNSRFGPASGRCDTARPGSKSRSCSRYSAA